MIVTIIIYEAYPFFNFSLNAPSILKYMRRSSRVFEILISTSFASCAKARVWIKRSKLISMISNFRFIGDIIQKYAILNIKDWEGLQKASD